MSNTAQIIREVAVSHHGEDRVRMYDSTISRVATLIDANPSDAAEIIRRNAPYALSYEAKQEMARRLADATPVAETTTPEQATEQVTATLTTDQVGDIVEVATGSFRVSASQVQKVLTDAGVYSPQEEQPLTKAQVKAICDVATSTFPGRVTAEQVEGALVEAGVYSKPEAPVEAAAEVEVDASVKAAIEAALAPIVAEVASLRALANTAQRRGLI